MKLAFFIILLICGSTQGLVRKNSFSSEDLVVQFAEYGFYKGGTLDLTISVSSSNSDVFYFFMSKDSNPKSFFGDGLTKFCEQMSSHITTPTFKRFEDSKIEVHQTILEDIDYYFYVVNCEKQGMTVDYKASLEFVNPKGEQLSAGLVPIPILKFFFLVFWILVAISWISNWIKVRDGKIWLHKLLTFVLFFTLTFIICDYVNWIQLSKHGNISDQFQIVMDVFSICVTFVSMLTILLIAKGWSITVKWVPASQIIFLILFSILLTALIQVRKGLQNPTSSFFVLVTIIIFLLIFMRLVLKSTSQNIKTLENKLTIIRRYDFQVENSPVWKKYQMFRFFLLTIRLVILLLIVDQITKIFLSSRYQWVGFLFDSLNQFLLCCFLAYTFKLRTINRQEHENWQAFLNQITEVDLQQQRQSLIDANVSGVEYMSYSDIALDKIPNLDDLEKQLIPVIIQNPPKNGQGQSHLAYQTDLKSLQSN
ncbi:lung seven transmembrane receptor [Anaeramoeba flamelloides]|uniref:Lung seven transmembrane receptor n=1 Tax=Anaeramoeba flamelloides TaxID=1746091 RepID=A0ABQ8YFJ8_9EUKA|nr:lung seven transmembrane receptor [Anaeramoeba flamelloides]